MVSLLELTPLRPSRAGRHALPRVPAPRVAASGAKRPDIQGLRALAVLLVIAAHAGISHLAGGFIGVDVFFVISGYLITSLLLRETERSGSVSLREFYARRARRILPAATVVLLVVLADVALTESPRQLTTAFHDAGWSAIFLANVHFARAGADYFAHNTTPSPFQHYWSLAVEEQFYVVWPLLIGLLSRRMTRRALTLVFGGILLASLIYSIHATGSNPASTYYSTPARAYELAAGAYLAIVMPRWPRQPSAIVRLTLGRLGLAAIVTAAFTLHADALFPGWLALIPVVGTICLLIAGSSGEPVGVSRAFGMQPLRYIGDISYSLYLWHWPILHLGYHWMPRWLPHDVQLTMLLILTFAISAASYTFIEQPFQHRRVPVLSRGHWSLAIWPVALTSVFLTGTVGDAYASHRQDVAKVSAAQWFKTHHAKKGKVSPDPGVHTPAVATINTDIGAALALAKQGAPIPPQLDTGKLAADDWHTRFHCDASWGATTTKICPSGDTSATVTVAVVGDSHAGHWLPALDVLAKRDHFKLVPILKMGCAPFDVRQSDRQMPAAECQSFRTWSRDQLATLHPDVIVAGARAELWMRAQSGQSIDQQWSAGVQSGVAALKELAPVVTVLSDIPHRQDAVDCVTRPHALQKDCITSARLQGSRSNSLTAAATEAAGGRYVDVVPLVCHAGRCPEVVGNRAVYYDDSHLTLSWAVHVAPALRELVGDLGS